jgi:hypothetical protein
MNFVYALARLVRGRQVWLWVIDICPICGQPHQHGGGPLDGNPRTLLGHRVPHCVPRWRGSRVVWTPPEGTDYRLTDDPALSGRVVEAEVAH